MRRSIISYFAYMCGVLPKIEIYIHCLSAVHVPHSSMFFFDILGSKSSIQIELRSIEFSKEKGGHLIMKQIL